MTTNEIRKQIVLRAPRSKVWRALTDHEQFGAWFKVRLDGPFVPGEHTRGNITSKGYEHVRMDVLVDKIEPEHHFAFWWHPAAIEPGRDYESEPRTLVEFRLDEVEGGTQLIVIESGFDLVPAGRRDEAFRMNEGGWQAQLGNIQRHVE
jgi:uncharacterized protein YndB with AHSA1/START domain